MFAIRLTLRPVTVPSRRAVSVMSWMTSRPWWAESIDSDRVSVNFTGRPTFVDTANAIHSSGVTASLPPNPPPTSGATTRILCSGVPVVAASRNRATCGIWVAEYIVHSPPDGSTMTLRGSMEDGIRRCWMYRRLMTTSASASAEAKLPPVPASPESKIHVYVLLVPALSWTSGEPGASAASMSRTTGSVS